MMIFWILMVPPILLWWKESIILILLMSDYANIEASAGAIEAQKAQKEMTEWRESIEGRLDDILELLRSNT